MQNNPNTQTPPLVDRRGLARDLNFLSWEITKIQDETARRQAMRLMRNGVPIFLRLLVFPPERD